MKIFAITPVKSLKDAKSRLASLLSVEERRMLSLYMLKDVLSSILDSGAVDGCLVVSSDCDVLDLAVKLGAEVLKEDRDEGVNAAVSKATSTILKRRLDCTIVFPSDIPLISPVDIKLIVDSCVESRMVVLTPSMKLDGTNALLRRPPDVIETSYERDSFNMHRETALRQGVKVKLYLSRRVMLDIDSPEDVKELMAAENRTLTQGYLSQISSRLLGDCAAHIK